MGRESDSLQYKNEEINLLTHEPEHYPYAE